MQAGMAGTHNGHVHSPPGAAPNGQTAGGSDSAAAAQLRARLVARTARVGVLGLGYVGLPLARALHRAGYAAVVGYDVDRDKIDLLRRGRSYIRHIPTADVAQLAQSDRFRASDRFEDLAACDVLVICLPTPVGPHNEPDMSYVETAARQIADRLLRPGVLVVLESTTYPGATDTDLVRILSASSGCPHPHRLGVDYFVAYSPEREDPANAHFTTAMIPKLVGGVDAVSGELAQLLYINGGFRKAVLVSSARVAECAKLLENIYRAVNIALVNELNGVFRGMEVDIWEVLDAAATKPFGFHRFDPGPGIGGHCIPVDPFYLAWKAKEVRGGAACSFIELAAQVNAGVPATVAARVQSALNERRRAVSDARVLLVGVAYKRNVDDMRCAPALDVWDALRALGAAVDYHDPYIPRIGHTRRHPGLAGTESVPFTKEAVRAAAYGAIVVLTDHDCFEQFEALDGFDGPVVDTRHCVRPRPGLHIVSA
jgi:UDP-N-acetyl-D-glucosamine dehydrogenase